MFKIQLSAEQMGYVDKLLEKRNFGNRGFADGNREEQRTGMMGQVAICDMFNHPRPTGGNGDDKGIDLIINKLKTDVKTMGRTCDPKPEYVNNFMGLQVKQETDILIFCSFNKRMGTLTVCGWIPKQEFFKYASRYKMGEERMRADGTSFKTKAHLYELRNDKLRQCMTEAELKGHIIEYGNSPVVYR